MSLKDMAGVNRSLVKANEELYVEAKKLRGLVDDLHVKHRELSAELGTCRDLQAKDQAELKRLKGCNLFLFPITLLTTNSFYVDIPVISI